MIPKLLAEFGEREVIMFWSFKIFLRNFTWSLALVLCFITKIILRCVNRGALAHIWYIKGRTELDCMQL